MANEPLYHDWHSSRWVVYLDKDVAVGEIIRLGSEGDELARDVRVVRKDPTRRTSLKSWRVEFEPVGPWLDFVDGEWVPQS